MTAVIETERQILRPLTLGDAEAAFLGFTGDAEAMKYVSWLPHLSIKDTIDWLKEIEWKFNKDGSIANSDNYIWGFELKATGFLIGSGGLIWEDAWNIFQVGYNINKDYWSFGYATEAMKAIIHFAFNRLGIKRLMGGHAKENIGSARVLEKLGFVYHHDSMTPHTSGKCVFDSREYMLDINESTNIRKVTGNKKEYLDLLLLADESEAMIDKYLQRSEMFVLDDGGIRAECVITKESDGTYEIKNIAVLPDCQRKGYGRKLIDFVFSYYTDCKAMLVGTGDAPSALDFYKSCGFTQSHKIKNFFTDNYDHSMFENGKQLIDMIYLKREK